MGTEPPPSTNENENLPDSPTVVKHAKAPETPACGISPAARKVAKPW